MKRNRRPSQRNHPAGQHTSKGHARCLRSYPRKTRHNGLKSQRRSTKKHWRGGRKTVRVIAQPYLKIVKGEIHLKFPALTGTHQHIDAFKDLSASPNQS